MIFTNPWPPMLGHLPGGFCIGGCDGCRDAHPVLGKFAPGDIVVPSRDGNATAALDVTFTEDAPDIYDLPHTD